MCISYVEWSMSVYSLPIFFFFFLKNSLFPCYSICTTTCKVLVNKVKFSSVCPLFTASQDHTQKQVDIGVPSGRQCQ